MKKIINFIFAISLVAGLFIGCNNSVTLSEETLDISGSRAVVPDAKRTSTIKIYVFNLPKDKPMYMTIPWNIWAWREEGATDTDYNAKAWPGGDYTLSADSNLEAVSGEFSVDPTYPLGILFNHPGQGGQGATQTKDIIIPKEKIQNGAELYFVYGETAYYSTPEECLGLRHAELAAVDGNSLTAQIVGHKIANVTKDSVIVKDNAGNALTVSAVTYDGSTATITLTDGALNKLPYTVTYDEVTKEAGVLASMIDEIGWTYDGNDLGVTFEGTKAKFKMWAPLASKVSLLLYDDVADVGNFKATTVAANACGSTEEAELKGTPAVDPIVMTKDNETDVWSYELENYSAYKYYKYEIVNNGTTYYVCDIHAKAASPDSIAAQLVDINAGTDYGTKQNYVNPFGNSGETPKSYADAVIYEIHIRDWAKAFDGEGKFIELAESEKFIAHLKEMGITHVQVVPMFDYAQVNSDKNYNWGYNPYHYNVPEGRYVKDMKDGMDAVNQLRQFIKALHDAGIAINMDVVYNHTAGIGGGSLYDSTVPEYFYRLVNGSYNNGSGCGNETASNHTMFKKYMIESLKHWMLDYHINGFRFDLMAIHEKDVMKEVYDELYKIDPNVMIYGEPWDGGGTKADPATTAAVESDTNPMGAGAFDDGFRNAIKGGEYGGFGHGQVQGTFEDAKIVAGLQGSNCTRNKTGNSALSLHYVECHDNYTLFDKLAMSYLNKTTFAGDLFAAIGADGLKAVKAQNKLAAAYVFLAQGTPFINGGQEFLRTKQGNHNSYSAEKPWTNEAGPLNIDVCNGIDLSFATKYADVVATYKGLIALRKDFSAFRYAKTAKAETVSDGVTKYDVTADDGNFTVLFNATDKSASVSEVKGKVVNVNGGVKLSGSYFGLGFNDASASAKKYTIADTETTVSSVPAKSFVILKK